jgi:hypothetical protein
VSFEKSVWNRQAWKQAVSINKKLIILWLVFSPDYRYPTHEPATHLEVLSSKLEQILIDLLQTIFHF